MSLKNLQQQYGRSGVVTTSTPSIGLEGMSKEEQEMILVAQAVEEAQSSEGLVHSPRPRKRARAIIESEAEEAESSESEAESESIGSESEEEEESSSDDESQASSPVRRTGAPTAAIGSLLATIPQHQIGTVVEALSARLSAPKKSRARMARTTSKAWSASPIVPDLHSSDKPLRQQTEDVDFTLRSCEEPSKSAMSTVARKKLELQVALSLSEAALEGTKASVQTLQASLRRLQAEQTKLRLLATIQRNTLGTLEALRDPSQYESCLDDIQLSYTGSLDRQEQVSHGVLRNSLQWLTGKLAEISGSTGMKVTKILSSTTLDQMG